ncbi:hypothetical protein CPC197_1311, partial [Chlamydia psittaci C1/97]
SCGICKVIFESQ